MFRVLVLGGVALIGGSACGRNASVSADAAEADAELTRSFRSKAPALRRRAAGRPAVGRRAAADRRAVDPPAADRQATLPRAAPPAVAPARHQNGVENA